jgi:hypothetical protein
MMALWPKARRVRDFNNGVVSGLSVAQSSDFARAPAVQNKARKCNEFNAGDFCRRGGRAPTNGVAPPTARLATASLPG